MPCDNPNCFTNTGKVNTSLCNYCKRMGELNKLKVKQGDYVLATRWSDGDPNDPGDAPNTVLSAYLGMTWNEYNDFVKDSISFVENNSNYIVPVR